MNEENDTKKKPSIVTFLLGFILVVIGLVLWAFATEIGTGDVNSLVSGLIWGIGISFVAHHIFTS